MTIFALIFINIITYKKRSQKKLTFGPRRGPRLMPRAKHLHLSEHLIKDFFSF